jgi:hypothetical protein
VVTVRAVVNAAEVTVRAAEAVAEADPEHPEENALMATLRSIELREVASQEETDSRARLVRMLTLWTDKTALAVVAVAIARVVTLKEAGAVTNPLPLVMALRRTRTPQRKRRRELPAASASPSLKKKRRKLVSPSTTTWHRRTLKPPAFLARPRK